MNAGTRNGFPRKPTRGLELDQTMFELQHALLYHAYTPEGLVRNRWVLEGAAFKTSAYFAGRVPIAPDSDKTYQVRISASLLTPWGSPVMFDEDPSCRPTGCYLAPGSIAEVTVPAMRQCVLMNNHSVAPPSAARYALTMYPFALGDSRIVVRAGCVTHAGYEIGQVVFQRPWSVGLGIFGQPDKKMVDALAGVFKPSFPMAILMQGDLHVHRDPAPTSNAEEGAGWSEPAALRGGALIAETKELPDWARILRRVRRFEGKDEPCGPVATNPLDGSRSGIDHLAVPLHGGQKEGNQFSVAFATEQQFAS